VDKKLVQENWWNGGRELMDGRKGEGGTVRLCLAACRKRAALCPPGRLLWGPREIKKLKRGRAFKLGSLLELRYFSLGCGLLLS
jgi:hypothetical protein